MAAANVSILQNNGKGWNKKLFPTVDEIIDYLCVSCSNVCKDAVELGCDHDDDEIELFCDTCLQATIKLNGGKCPINQNHINPVIQSSRLARRKILKLKVLCLYSKMIFDQNMNDNDNNGIYDTPDQKEGGNNINNSKYCQWSGSLNELINVHIKQCAIISQDILLNNIQNINQKIVEIQKNVQNNNDNLSKQDIFMKLQFGDLQSLILMQQNTMNQININLTNKIKILEKNEAISKKQFKIIENKLLDKNSEIFAVKLQLNDLKDLINDKILKTQNKMNKKLKNQQNDDIAADNDQKYLPLAYNMNNKWDKWDKNTLGKGMSVSYNGYVLKRGHIGLRSYAFGTKPISSGVTLWRFKILKGDELNYIGIIETSGVVANSASVHSTVSQSYIFKNMDTGYTWSKKKENRANYSIRQATGTIVCMKLDFGNHTLSYSYDKKPFKFLFNNINTQLTYKLACSICNSCLELLASKTY